MSEGDVMKTILRALLALMPLSIGTACLVLCAALTLPLQANAGGPAPAEFKIMYADRTELGDGIAHYRYDVAMGPGKYDVVRIHRIVREKRPDKPVRTLDAVMLLPGNPNFFEQIFMAPMVTGVGEPDHSIVVFLAAQDIDVWGMDYGWALVPAEETDFSFMGEWGLAKDIGHARQALAFVRSMRVASGQGNGRLHVLGFSYGAMIAYPLAGEETLLPRGLRSVKGLIALDFGVKFGVPSDREFYCALAPLDEALLASNPPDSYANSAGQFFGLLGYLATYSPDEESPVFPPLTNRQAALFLGTSTELVTGQFWHFVGGYLDEFGVPSSLRFTDDELWLGIMGTTPPWYPVRVDVDGDHFLCGDDTPFDDHLAGITVPILHVGAKGGVSESAYASAAFTASWDVTTITVQQLPDEAEGQDFAHADTALARDAEQLVWWPILDWILAHRANRP